MSAEHFLVATLGGQPQIVTFTLDLLLARGQRIDQVVVVYLGGEPRYLEAYRRLGAEFGGDRYAGRTCHLRGWPVRLAGHALSEARTPQEIEAVRQAFFDLFVELKQRGAQVHLSLSGGRRVLALTALATAMQLLTPADRLYHLYTPPDLTERARSERLMHLPAGTGTELIDVPFVPWGAYFPGLKPLLGLGGQPLAAIQLGWQDEAEHARCRQAWELLTARQRQALRLLVEGRSRQQMAQELQIKITTIDSHCKAIRAACEQVWSEQPGEPVNRTWLREHFMPFLAGIAEV